MNELQQSMLTPLGYALIEGTDLDFDDENNPPRMREFGPVLVAVAVLTFLVGQALRPLVGVPFGEAFAVSMAVPGFGLLVFGLGALFGTHYHLKVNFREKTLSKFRFGGFMTHPPGEVIPFRNLVLSRFFSQGIGGDHDTYVIWLTRVGRDVSELQGKYTCAVATLDFYADRTEMAAAHKELFDQIAANAGIPTEDTTTAW